MKSTRRGISNGILNWVIYRNLIFLVAMAGGYHMLAGGTALASEVPVCVGNCPSCEEHCFGYNMLDEGGCWDAVDYCTYENGCPFGETDSGEGCCCGPTPILIDVLGNGFDLTDGYSGVHFDMGGDGHREPIAWT